MAAAVEDVIPDMKWILDHVDDAASAVATTLPYVSYSLDDARKSGMHYAMINLAESDCPGCQKSAGEIASGGAAVVAAGGVVIEVLETTGFVNQPTQANLQAWINASTAPRHHGEGPRRNGDGHAEHAAGPREHCYIIAPDLTTMKILQVIMGDLHRARRRDERRPRDDPDAHAPREVTRQHFT